MKQRLSIHLFLIIALLTSASLAQVAPPAPAELTTLRTRYRSDLQTSREPIRTRYVASLDALLRSTTKNGDLDAALAVQHELNTAKGKAGTVSGGKITPELAALKSRYEADVQTASEALQSRYFAALEALQDSFTKRGQLPAALAVRQELSTLKPVAHSPDPTATGQSPAAKLPIDANPAPRGPYGLAARKIAIRSPSTSGSATLRARWQPAQR